ncbi:glycosyl hydrolase [Mrakia frigida]|uniref:glycoside hydrolase family 32 protein n=1 Tax=Mrakia frigida TaxID=29902 RepID=UPI003FCC129B
MLPLLSSSSLLLLTSAAVVTAFPRAAELDLPGLRSIKRQTELPNNSTSSAECDLDQTKAPTDLTLCGNATLFTTFRPKARFIAPEGWMNDPMGMYQRDDGSIHAGYQYHPQHIQWGNISQGAAWSSDMTFWYDYQGHEGAKTIWPSEVYDIRGVFDGSILNPGHNGYPTILYTSTYTSRLGATVPGREEEGAETQSIAWTEDGGASWIKLPYGSGGNPVLTNWPERNVTGFRDPYIFRSPQLSALIGSTNSTSVANGTHFSTISGGRHDIGPKLWLYRQKEDGNALDWEYLGGFVGEEGGGGVGGVKSSWSEWSGNFGSNFETAFVSRLNATGDATDDPSDSATDFVSYGTEQGRPDHQAHWPLWSAIEYSARADGSVNTNILYSGVLDWGQSYAFVAFPVKGDSPRSVVIGWTYEDDASLALATQQGYQGAFTLFRDLYLKTIPNVDASRVPDLYEKAAWAVKNETDGSITVETLGQHVIPETVAAYKAGSNVAELESRDVKEGFEAFETQPTGRFYVLAGSFELAANSTHQVGFRVLSSDQEYTDILYDVSAQNLTVNRSASSLIKSYGNATETGKLKLWPIVGEETLTLNLTVFVDNSVVEIFANDELAITTRVYPWLSNSTGAGLLSVTGTGSPVKASGLELWDGLVNAWPDRAENTSTGLVWDGPTAALYGLWSGI